MLLSLPNWIIHVFSSLEWGGAAFLLFRHGSLSGRPALRIFGLSMLPHWVGSFFVLGYHATGDAIPFMLDMSEVINLFGSIALLLATMNILRRLPKPAESGITASVFIGTMLIAGRPQSWMGEDVFDLILQLSSVVYLTFLVLLVMVWKRDRTVFSGVTVGGFWFVLVFILVTVGCMYVATGIRGYPTLSHDDLLHGAAESLLSISNLLIAIGAQKSITQDRLKRTGRPLSG
ncbi:DUF3593 domain-containing protein [Pelodictyon luteolum]|uniref:DUF3593 domain-containing protein n=1 Tax=Chlorobium luteolum (strain DSM 273 / BCRC 81028 / 2530) TaxID=319225 RepID=Q3B6X4_CHLL3|nr:DUF3593 domain-containing protein [Pelodictyon luteolum]ABB22907.1 conserved hypothetical protein [Pelodictyon luteolum DSM 273]